MQQTSVKAAILMCLTELEIAPFDPPTPKTLPEKQTYGVDRITRSRDDYRPMAITITTGAFGTRILREEEVVGGHPSSIVPLERAMVLSYTRNRRNYNIYVNLVNLYSPQWAAQNSKSQKQQSE